MKKASAFTESRKETSSRSECHLHSCAQNIVVMDDLTWRKHVEVEEQQDSTGPGNHLRFMFTMETTKLLPLRSDLNQLRPLDQSSDPGPVKTMKH